MIKEILNEQGLRHPILDPIKWQLMTTSRIKTVSSLKSFKDLENNKMKDRNDVWRTLVTLSRDSLSMT